MTVSAPNTAKTAPKSQPDVIMVDAHADQVACDGGGGSLGHPLTYYSFDAGNTVECLYCDRVFSKKVTVAP